MFLTFGQVSRVANHQGNDSLQGDTLRTEHFRKGFEATLVFFVLLVEEEGARLVTEHQGHLLTREAATGIREVRFQLGYLVFKGLCVHLEELIRKHCHLEYAVATLKGLVVRVEARA